MTPYRVKMGSLCKKWSQNGVKFTPLRKRLLHFELDFTLFTERSPFLLHIFYSVGLDYGTHVCH